MCTGDFSKLVSQLYPVTEQRGSSTVDPSSWSSGSNVFCEGSCLSVHIWLRTPSYAIRTEHHLFFMIWYLGRWEGREQKGTQHSQSYKKVMTVCPHRENQDDLKKNHLMTQLEDSWVLYTFQAPRRKVLSLKTSCKEEWKLLCRPSI